MNKNDENNSQKQKQKQKQGKCGALKLIAVFIFIFISFALPKYCDAKYMDIKNDPITHEYKLDTFLYVAPDDIVKILPGTKIVAGPAGYIYSKGTVFVGIGEPDGNQGVVDASGGAVATGVTSGASTSTTSSLAAGPSDINTVQIFSSSSKPFIQLNGGSLIMVDTNFFGHSVLEAYNRSTAEISGLNAKISRVGTDEYSKTNSAFSVFGDSSLELSYSVVHDNEGEAGESVIGSLFQVFSSSSLSLIESKIYSNNSSNTFSIYQKSRGVFSKGNIFSCQKWLMVYSDSKVTGLLNRPSCTNQAEYIFGNSVSTVSYADISCCSSVLFIPGLFGSRLYKKESAENQLWESNSPFDIKKMFMGNTGQSIDASIYTKDVITSSNLFGTVASKKIYQTFIESLVGLKRGHIIADFAVWPYDWRLRQGDIVTSEMVQKIITLAQSSENGRVSIVAHSYGGFVTKELLAKLKAINKEHLIDHVILVAVPETGAPMPIFTLMNGYIDSQILNFLTNSKVISDLAMNMPSVYELLPSTKYKDRITLSFKAIQGALALVKSIDLANHDLMHSPRISMWLKDRILEALPQNKKIAFSKTTNIFNSLSSRSVYGNPVENQILFDEHKLHEGTSNVADQMIRQTFKTWSIIGLGIQTMSGADYEFTPCVIGFCNGVGKLAMLPRMSTNGDGTVIFDANENRLGQLLQIDLSKANQRDRININHGNILESKYIIQAIQEILTKGEVINNSGDIYIGDGSYYLPKDIVTIGVTGNVLGGITAVYGTTTYQSIILDNYSNFSYINNVPNTSIDKIGESVYISTQEKNSQVEFVSPAIQKINIQYQAAMTESGTQSSYTKEIPVTIGSVVKLENFGGWGTGGDTSNTQQNSSGTSTAVTVDYDGNGTVDDTYIVPIGGGINPNSTTMSQGTTSTTTNPVIISTSTPQTTASSTVSTTTPTDLLIDLRSIKAEVMTAKQKISTLNLFIYRDIYSKTLDLVLKKVISIESRVMKDKYPKNNLLSTNEKNEILMQYTWIQKAVIQMEEFDKFYIKQLGFMDRLTILKINNANIRRVDLGQAFLAMSRLESKVLEFIQKHVNITN